MEERLRADGTRIGVIYNGFAIDKTDEEWTQHAEDHFNTLERDASLVPDDAIIATWNRYPAHFLPETQPGTSRLNSSRRRSVTNRRERQPRQMRRLR